MRKFIFYFLIAISYQIGLYSYSLGSPKEGRMESRQIEEMILKKDWQVTEYVGKMDQSFIPMLLKLTKNPDWEVRQLSLICLAHFKTRESAQALAVALLDEDVNVRGYAAGLLQEADDPIILPQLLRALKKSEDEHVRAQIVLVIGRIGNEETKEELKKILPLEKDKTTRANIIQALARLQDEDSRQKILKELQSATAQIRFAAIQKIEYIGDKEMALHLEPLLDDKTPATTLTASATRAVTLRINEVAVKAIAVIYNQPFPFRMENLRPCTDQEIQEAKQYLQKIKSSLRKR